ncbi:Uu.00g023390.m01.CDS01 [Anthostomella pinea]|uniref:Uu.00g023390.m01.CDS01 n=1 Tax=Anthostomella pinea TaxID=933095 RepID=A0AAI8W0Z5_9PEZI|nr:Uu.00g023390.m01.CDS01 [Anthostomella pinea]
MAEVLGSIAAAVQLVECGNKGYQRFKRVRKAPRHLAAQLEDVLNKVSLLEKLKANGSSTEVLATLTDQALAEARKLVGLIDYPALAGPAIAGQTPQTLESWRDRLRLRWNFVRKEGKLDRLHRAIEERVPWLILTYLESHMNKPLGAGFKTFYDMDVPGQFEPQLVTAPATSQVSLPPSYHTFENKMPLWRNSFYGRSDELHMLQQMLEASLKQPRAAVIGLPGIGKTRLVFEYVRTAQVLSREPFILRICATNETRLGESLQELALTLNPMHSQDRRKPSVTCVLERLNVKSGNPLFLIVDDVQDANITYEGTRLTDLLPDNPSITILFTARDKLQVSGFVSKNCTISLGPLSQAESQQMLLEDSTDSEPDRQAAEQLAARLNSWPLTIAQARSFTEQSSISLPAYLELLDAEPYRLLQHKIRDGPEETRRSLVQSLLDLSHSIHEENTLAYQVLNLTACFDNTKVPRVLYSAAGKGVERVDLTTAVGVLHRHGLIDRCEDEAISINSVVHTIVRHRLVFTPALQHYLELAKNAVLAILPERQALEAAIQQANPCTQHAMSVLNIYTAHAHLARDDSLAALSSKLIWHLQSQGSYSEALTYSKTAQALLSTTFGTEHPLTIAARSDLARSLYQTGQLLEADREMQVVAAAQQRVQGPHHTATISAMNQLATIKCGLRDHAEAERLYVQVWNAQQTVLGAGHVHTLATRQNLAIAVQSQGPARYVEAEAHFRAVLAAKRGQRGGGHDMDIETETDTDRDTETDTEIEDRDRDRDYYTTLSNLGTVLLLQRRLEAAWQHHTVVLSWRRAALGPSHPETIGSLTNTARILQELGGPASASASVYLAAAEAIWREGVEWYESVFGREHYETLNAQMNLATVLHRRGRWAEALGVARGVCAVRRRRLGPRHGDTVAVGRWVGGLGEWLGGVGDWEGEDDGGEDDGGDAKWGDGDLVELCS